MAQQFIPLGSGEGTPGSVSRHAAFQVCNANAEDAEARLSQLSDALVTVVAGAKTASHTLVLADAGTVVDVNTAAASAVTVPADATLLFPIQTVLEVCQLGDGPVSVAPAAGVTINGLTTAFLLRARYSSVSLRKIAANAWVISGDYA